jgi:hypothetical protein
VGTTGNPTSSLFTSCFRLDLRGIFHIYIQYNDLDISGFDWDGKRMKNEGVRGRWGFTITKAGLFDLSLSLMKFTKSENKISLLHNHTLITHSFFPCEFDLKHSVWEICRHKSFYNIQESALLAVHSAELSSRVRFTQKLHNLDLERSQSNTENTSAIPQLEPQCLTSKKAAPAVPMNLSI